MRVVSYVLSLPTMPVKCTQIRIFASTGAWPNMWTSQGNSFRVELLTYHLEKRNVLLRALIARHQVQAGTSAETVFFCPCRVPRSRQFWPTTITLGITTYTRVTSWAVYYSPRRQVCRSSWSWGKTHLFSSCSYGSHTMPGSTYWYIPFCLACTTS